MTHLQLQVDQHVSIGRQITVVATDIDAKTVRVIARGIMFGGPNDGGPFETVHELSKGQSFPIGDAITVTLIEVVGTTAHFGVHAPANMGVALT